MDAALLEPLDHSLGVEVDRLLPAGGRHLAAARVDGHDHAVSVETEHVVEKVDVGERGGTEDDALGAGVERVPDSADAPQPTAVLDRHRKLGDDLLEVAE